MEDQRDRYLTIRFINPVDHPPTANAIAEIPFQRPFEFLDIPVLMWILPKALETKV
jgi:hypothetical protein